MGKIEKEIAEEGKDIKDIKDIYDIYNILLVIIIAVVVFIILFIDYLPDYLPDSKVPDWMIGHNRLVCDGVAKGNDDLFYSKNINEFFPYKNRCEIKNKTIVKIEEERNLAIANKEKEVILESKICYDSGKDYNYTLDLIQDYNYTCNQIEYINDHFILGSKKEVSGKIKVYHSGLFTTSSTDIKLYEWVYSESVATGSILKTINYHLDCENSTLEPKESRYDPFNKRKDTRRLSYYTESDFIMYYVDNCVGDE